MTSDLEMLISQREANCLRVSKRLPEEQLPEETNRQVLNIPLLSKLVGSKAICNHIRFEAKVDNLNPLDKFVPKTKTDTLKRKSQFTPSRIFSISNTRERTV